MLDLETFVGPVLGSIIRETVRWLIEIGVIR
jgi:hypothetical protein